MFVIQRRRLLVENHSIINNFCGLLYKETHVILKLEQEGMTNHGDSLILNQTKDLVTKMTHFLGMIRKII